MNGGYNGVIRSASWKLIGMKYAPGMRIVAVAVGRCRSRNGTCCGFTFQASDLGG